MISKLETATPPFPGADIAAAKIAFESAVARVEAEAMEREAATAAAVGAPPLSPDLGLGGTSKELRVPSSGAPAGIPGSPTCSSVPRTEPTMDRATFPAEHETAPDKASSQPRARS
jgi:hypothetical protein